MRINLPAIGCGPANGRGGMMRHRAAVERQVNQFGYVSLREPVWQIRMKRGFVTSEHPRWSPNQLTQSFLSAALGSRAAIQLAIWPRSVRNRGHHKPPAHHAQSSAESRPIDQLTTYPARELKR